MSKPCSVGKNCTCCPLLHSQVPSTSVELASMPQHMPRCEHWFRHLRNQIRATFRLRHAALVKVPQQLAQSGLGISIVSYRRGCARGAAKQYLQTLGTLSSCALQP
jgi:hypothetical protein